jgi:hypothetical protein
MKILNLTQHPGTPEQGVLEPSAADKAAIQSTLTFDELPCAAVILQRVEQLLSIAVTYDCDTAMIGGAPYLMSALEAGLMDASINPVYAFSVRESVEETQPDGSVRKVNVFRHKGWVQPR